MLFWVGCFLSELVTVVLEVQLELELLATVTLVVIDQFRRSPLVWVSELSCGTIDVRGFAVETGCDTCVGEYCRSDSTGCHTGSDELGVSIPGYIV